MKNTALPIAALLALATAGSVFADEVFYEGNGRDGAPPRGAIVVSDQAPTMSVWDYFFNNPEKYRSIRNDPGEFHKGAQRR